MIVDTSALVAVVFAETGHKDLITKLARSTSAGMGAPTVAETSLVLSSRLDRDARDLVARLLDDFDIVEVPFGRKHWRAATDAFWRFGRGRHEAKLNFGDCLTYSVAQLADEPLLFVGEDFAATDLRAA